MIRRFNRFELKYLVRAAQKDRLTETLAREMNKDAHGTDGSYRLASLYLDSPDLSCFFAKEEGIRFRRKVRFRIYGRFLDDPSGTVHVEIKQRISKTVQKRRVKSTLETAMRWISGEETPSLADPLDQAVAEEVVTMAGNLNLQPTCVTSYLREAWVGSDAESGLRITFDSEVGCRGPEDLLGSRAKEYLFLPSDTFIMEVKVNEAIPIWVTRLLAREECAMRRISKYCEGVRTLRSVRAARRPEEEEVSADG